MKRREDAVARGTSHHSYFSSLAAEWLIYSVPDSEHLTMSKFAFGSRSGYRRKELATIFSYYSSWHCKWNSYPSSEIAICCIYNIPGYVHRVQIFGFSLMPSSDSNLWDCSSYIRILCFYFQMLYSILVALIALLLIDYFTIISAVLDHIGMLIL